MKNKKYTLTNTVRQERTLLGHSRKCMAENIGIHYNTLAAIEEGRFGPGLLIAMQIARYLKKDVNELFKLVEL